MKDAHGLLTMAENHTMGHGKVTDISQLPSDKILLEYIGEAVAFNEQGAKAPAPKKKPKVGRAQHWRPALALDRNAARRTLRRDGTAGATRRRRASVLSQGSRTRMTRTREMFTVIAIHPS